MREQDWWFVFCLYAVVALVALAVGITIAQEERDRRFAWVALLFWAWPVLLVGWVAVWVSRELWKFLKEMPRALRDGTGVVADLIRLAVKGDPPTEPTRDVRPTDYGEAVLEPGLSHRRRGGAKPPKHDPIVFPHVHGVPSGGRTERLQ